MNPNTDGLRIRQSPIAILSLVALLLCIGSAPKAVAQSTAFNYSGRLCTNGMLLSGPYDMQFNIYDASVVGNAIGSAVTVNSVNVANGLFTVRLDFGAGVFTGPARWLDVAVRPVGSSTFTPLAPRLEITSSPYSIRSQTDSSSGGSNNWSLTGTNAYFNTGNVGIGIANPATALEASGIVRSTRAGVPDQYIQLDSGDPLSIRLSAQSTAGAEKNLVIRNLSGEATAGPNNAIEFVLGTTAAPSTKMSINKDGNVLMHPGGSGGTIQFGTPNFETGMTIIGANRADVRFDGSTLKLIAGAGAGIPPSGNGIAIDTAGNVGIGTFFPQTKLHVESAGTLVSTFKSGTDRTALSLDSTIGGQQRIWTLENGLFGLQGLFGIYDQTAAQARLAITANGNVGVGTFAPVAQLQVETGATKPAVYGNATADGTGVYGRSASGFAMVADGNAKQARDKGGWAKAMLFVEATGEIIRAYNGMTGESFQGPPSANAVGFSVTHSGGGGLYRVDFGFQVSDRFISVTPGQSGSNPNTTAVLDYGVGTEVFVFTRIGGDSASAKFTIIVF